MRRLPIVALAACLLAVPVARAEDPPVLRLGLHIPETGGAPVPAVVMHAGANLYWRYLHHELGSLVHGRRIELIVSDDAFSPTTAVTVCNRMATEDGALLLLEAIGTDQINACASYADQRGIPYLSPGVQEMGLDTRETYFALSPTYPAQGRILAEFIVNALGSSVDTYRSPRPITERACSPVEIPILETEVPVPVLEKCPPDPELNGVRIALVRQNTPNYNGAEIALQDALRALGTDLHEVYSVLKEGFDSEADTIASQMEADGIDVVITTTSPILTLRLAQHASGGDYFPRYVMYGMTSGFNAVARIGCDGDDPEEPVPTGSLAQATAFSAWPGWDAVSAGGFEPAFPTAVETLEPGMNTADSGDVMLWMWGLMKNIHFILEAVGPDPAREDILAMLNTGYAHSTGVFPDFSVDSDDHFGADALHRLEVDCDADGGPQFVQRDAFVTGYPAP